MFFRDQRDAKAKAHVTDVHGHVFGEVRAWALACLRHGWGVRMVCTCLALLLAEPKPSPLSLKAIRLSSRKHGGR